MSDCVPPLVLLFFLAGHAIYWRTERHHTWTKWQSFEVPDFDTDACEWYVVDKTGQLIYRDCK